MFPNFNFLCKPFFILATDCDIFTEKHLARICYKCARRELFGSKYNYNKRFKVWIEEIKENPQSRSAKLRFAIKENDISSFEEEILKKFNYLLEVEKLSEKI